MAPWQKNLQEILYQVRLMSVDFVFNDDLEFVHHRTELELTVRVGGRFSLASRRDQRGNRRLVACRAIKISPSRLMLATPIVGPVGERVIAYFEEFGKLHGPITRVFNGGLLMKIASTTEGRSRLLRRLFWLEQNTKYDAPDLRAHRRIIPSEPISTIVYPDGTMLECFVIDISASGAAVSADVVPDVGTILAIGQVPGKVVRHFAEGFAVKFKQTQRANLVEKLVIRRW